MKPVLEWTKEDFENYIRTTKNMEDHKAFMKTLSPKEKYYLKVPKCKTYLDKRLKLFGLYFNSILVIHEYKNFGLNKMSDSQFEIVTKFHNQISLKLHFRLFKKFVVFEIDTGIKTSQEEYKKITNLKIKKELLSKGITE